MQQMQERLFNAYVVFVFIHNTPVRIPLQSHCCSKRARRSEQMLFFQASLRRADRPEPGEFHRCHRQGNEECDDYCSRLWTGNRAIISSLQWNTDSLFQAVAGCKTMDQCCRVLTEQYPYVKFCRILASDAQMSHNFVIDPRCSRDRFLSEMIASRSRMVVQHCWSIAVASCSRRSFPLPTGLAMISLPVTWRIFFRSKRAH